METVKSLKDYSDQAELLRIQEKSKYLESYDDINCYTKPGPIEDSYVVYVTYYAKFHDKMCIRDRSILIRRSFWKRRGYWRKATDRRPGCRRAGGNEEREENRCLKGFIRINMWRALT